MGGDEFDDPAATAAAAAADIWLLRPGLLWHWLGVCDLDEEEPEPEDDPEEEEEKQLDDEVDFRVPAPSWFGKEAPNSELVRLVLAEELRLAAPPVSWSRNECIGSKAFLAGGSPVRQRTF